MYEPAAVSDLRYYVLAEFIIVLYLFCELMMILLIKHKTCFLLLVLHRFEQERAHITAGIDTLFLGMRCMNR